MAQLRSGDVLRGARWDAAGRLRAMPDSVLAAIVRELPDDGVEALADLLFALRDTRTPKERKRR